MQLPWQPLFTIERSSLPEVTVYGVISVIDGAGKEIISIGNVNCTLWSRSLLKPWQLMCRLPELQETYPNLGTHFYALMLSSHNGEPEQIQYIKELLGLGKLTERDLQCPASMPASDSARHKLILDGSPAAPIYNPCSGKHTGILLSLKARNEDISKYLDRQSAHIQRLEQLLSWLVKRPVHDLPVTTDGCQLPNYGFSAKEIASLYGGLVIPSLVPKDKPYEASVTHMLEFAHLLAPLMNQHPELVGGTNRLDTKLMSNKIIEAIGTTIVAKEGADGLLGVGIAPCNQCPAGIGILVKISSGYQPNHLETIITALLTKFGFKPAQKAAEQPAHLKTSFHFLEA